ncbi:MAG: TonB-dependent receptor domain-containing protein, partial [Terriglobia bacterium]
MVETARAQSSQAALQGQVADESGRPMAGALVLLRNRATNAQSYRYANAQGLYYFSAVLPGVYSVRVDALGYLPEERPAVELPVAARLELNFALMASGTTTPPPRAAPAPGPPSPQPARGPANLLAAMYGADAAVPQAIMSNLPVSLTETLVGSLSSLIDETRIRELPLAGRDVYTLLVLQPGVTSDNAAGRGLGFAVHGQRAGSSNFLLDGVDNNDLLVTGPAARVSAEAVQEYRLNTSNFTAEFGRASGFIANAITRSGTNGLHGTAFEYFNHDRLNANSFSYNWQDVSRPPFRQNQYGGVLGGPIQRDRLFFFGNFEQARSSSQSQPLWVVVPGPEFVSVASIFPDIPASLLFSRVPLPNADPIPGIPYYLLKNFVVPAVEVNTLGFGRLDYTFPNYRHRLSGRYAFSQQTLENFFFSVYPGLNAPLGVRNHSIAVNLTQEVAGGTNELKFATSRNRMGAYRPQPDLPSMQSDDDLLLPTVSIATPEVVGQSGIAIPLPGMDSFSQYVFRGTSFNVIENFSRLVDRHALALGFEWRHGLSDALFPFYRSGHYQFEDFENFLFGLPDYLAIPLSRQTGLPGTDADYWTFHRQNEFAGFLQDNLSLTPRLKLNLGLRFEYFGAPAARKTTRDWNFAFGAGQTPGERIANGEIVPGRLFRSDFNNVAPRFGFAYDLFGTGRSVLRGGYGIFYDRILNNVWLNTRNNNLPLQYLRQDLFKVSVPASKGVVPIIPETLSNNYTVAVDRNLRAPYVQSWFLGFQQELSPNLILDVNHVGSVGRKLLTSDGINRPDSVQRTLQNRLGRYNPDFSGIVYYGNQGQSDHLGFEVALHRRWSRGMQFQVNYTFSRSRDVQSDPLVPPRTGASSVTNPLTRRLASSVFETIPTFTRRLDPRSDFGDSDYDQRHNLILNAVALL